MSNMLEIIICDLRREGWEQNDKDWQLEEDIF